MAKYNDQNSKPESKSRELPKSLQAIETILKHLNEKDKELSSIRNISDVTGLSMRVIKNVLIQLEKFNQVKKITEKNNLLPKWGITKLGKEVISKAKEEVIIADLLGENSDLLQNIKIPKILDDLKRSSKAKQEAIISKFRSLTSELNKILGSILNLDPPNPAFENLISVVIKRIRQSNQEISNLPFDPLKKFEVVKIGEKQRKISSQETHLLFVELYFFYSLINNQLMKITTNVNKLTDCLEKNGGSGCFNIAYDLNKENRILKGLIENLKTVNISSHVLSEEELVQLSENDINPAVLEGIIELTLSEEEQLKSIKEIILEILGKLNAGEKEFHTSGSVITDNIPLYALYQLIIDSKPLLNFTIEQLEQVIDSLADEGYIPGIKTIQSDEDHYLKVVQLKERDISEAEHAVISHAINFESFSLADMVLATSMPKENVSKILESLTEAGILKNSNSFLHGEQWYVATAWNWNDKKERIRQDLAHFEQEMRDFIKNSLVNYHGKQEWWSIGIPDYIKNKVEERMQSRQQRDPKAEFELIDFLDFSDYFSIIFNNKNWTKIFSKTFPDKRSLEYPLEKLRLIRNDVVHVHANPEDLNKYNVYIDEIKKFLKNG